MPAARAFCLSDMRAMRSAMPATLSARYITLLLIDEADSGNTFYVAITYARPLGQRRLYSSSLICYDRRLPRFAPPREQHW